MILNNKTNINIGGDHSMGIGSVGASLNKYGPGLKVIWIDAHADINTRKSSPSGNFHGMPLAFLTGLDKSDDFDYICNLLPFENLCYIGIRDLDEEEISVVKKHNIKTVLTENFNNHIDTVIENIINWVGNSPVHISFDVDSLDPKYIQYTGTRVSEGLDLDQLVKFMGNMCASTDVKNIDLSELNLYNPDCVSLLDDEKTKSFDNFNLVLETIRQSLVTKTTK
jgi:arginase